MDYVVPVVLGRGSTSDDNHEFCPPPVSTVGLYEAYFPHCTVLIDAKSASTVRWEVESGSFVCTQQGAMLEFGTPAGFLLLPNIPKVRVFPILAPNGVIIIRNRNHICFIAVFRFLPYHGH